MKNLSLFFFALILSTMSCSNLSKNLIKKGNLIIHSGKSGDKSWDDNLVFKRVSWFKELTQFFDLIYVKLDPNSPFSQWISASEKDFLQECAEPWIVLTYAHDATRISPAMLFTQIEKHGFKKRVLNDFSRNLRMHPDYEKMSLVLHKIYGLCVQTNLIGKEITFPGFETIIL